MKDWFEYLEVTRQSKAKQQDVDNLVKENKSWKTNNYFGIFHIATKGVDTFFSV